MKAKLLLILSFFSFISILLFSNEKKEKVAVLNFKAANISTEIAYAVTENLITCLTELEIFQIIERGQLDKIFEELKLTSEDDFDDVAVIEIGKLAKAKLILIGSVTQFGKKITINVRGIDVETGKALFGRNVITKRKNKLPKIIKKLAILIAEGYYVYSLKKVRNRHQENDDEILKINKKLNIPKKTVDVLCENQHVIIEKMKSLINREKKCDMQPLELITKSRKRHIKNMDSKIFQKNNQIIWKYSIQLKSNKLRIINENERLVGLKFFNFSLLEEEIKENTGLFLKCFSRIPCSYIIQLDLGDEILRREIVINKKTQEYLIPFDSFFPVSNENKRNLELVITIFQSFYDIQNSIEMVNNEVYQNEFILEELGLFNYMIEGNSAIVNNFNHPIDKTRNINLYQNKLVKDPRYNTIDFFRYSHIEYDIKSEGAYLDAGKYFYYKYDFIIKKEILPIIKDANFSAVIFIDLQKDISSYTGISFLLKGKGIKKIACSFSSDLQDNSFSQMIPIENEGEWFRVLIDFNELKNKYGKILQLEDIQNMEIRIEKWAFVSSKDTSKAIDTIIGKHEIILGIDEIKLINEE